MTDPLNPVAWLKLSLDMAGTKDIRLDNVPAHVRTSGQFVRAIQRGDIALRDGLLSLPNPLESSGDPILDAQALCKAEPLTRDQLIGRLFEQFGWPPGMCQTAVDAGTGVYFTLSEDGAYEERGTIEEIVAKAASVSVPDTEPPPARHNLPPFPLPPHVRDGADPSFNKQPEQSYDEAISAGPLDGGRVRGRTTKRGVYTGGSVAYYHLAWGSVDEKKDPEVLPTVRRDEESVWQILPLFDGLPVPWPKGADERVTSLDLLEHLQSPVGAVEQDESLALNNGWMWRTTVDEGTGVKTFRKVRRPTSEEAGAKAHLTVVRTATPGASPEVAK